MSTIYKGSGGKISINPDFAFQELIIEIIGRATRESIGKFSTADRGEGWVQMTGSGPYEAALTEVMTLAMESEMHDVEIKAIINDVERPVGVAEIGKAERSSVGKYTKHE